MARIISYNVNGIRSAIEKGLVDWIRAAQPDVLCVQETKAQPEQIPQQLFEDLGYHCYWFSAEKKGYSGVGILTRLKPDHIQYGMGIQQYDAEGRWISMDYGSTTLVSVYHPSGSSGDDRQAFKMVWLEDFLDYVHDLRQTRPNLILSGDFNICHKPIDIHDPVRNATSSGFLPEEREWMDRFLNGGFVDSFRAFNQEPHQYSWWSFRAGARNRNLGWRIDYHMVSQALASDMTGAKILPQAKHSDHCPVVLDINL
ncbi:MAG: exodeoxyribonuclease III [Lentimicrobiaceae bacterium]|nr:exodeoxyribonuclease III [Lentimicrobiaceae bacterium]